MLPVDHLFLGAKQQQQHFNACMLLAFNNIFTLALPDSLKKEQPIFIAAIAITTSIMAVVARNVHLLRQDHHKQKRDDDSNQPNDNQLIKKPETGVVV
jgi:hypothetical protein